MPGLTWIVVLIKDFTHAKSRLAPMLAPESRRALAVAHAMRAVESAMQVAPTLAICGSVEAATIAGSGGADVVLEASPRDQNSATALGVAEVIARDGNTALILSSDLPLVDAAALARMIQIAERVPGPVAVAAAALGRQGTNALYMRPLGGFDLHFGEASLPRFAEEARRRGRAFIRHDDPRLALDLDEPGDVAVWEQLRAAV